MPSKTFFRFVFRIGLHGLFWLGVLVFYTYFFGFNSDDKSYVFSFSLFLMPITISLCYLFTYKIIPDYLITKRYVSFVKYTLYAIIISAYLLGLSMFYGLIYLSNFDAQNMSPISKNLIFVMLAVYLVVLVVASFKLLQLNFKSSVENSELQTKMLQAQIKLKEQELSYLKMQIHPHFLFNTLNTLYGFALKKAEETPEMILKLSNLLDYLLYQMDKPKVLLSSELEHIQDYIDLETLRFRDTLEVTLTIGEFPSELSLPPMLLIPFVENSFKHGDILNGHLTIDIKISYQKPQLSFTVINSVSAKRKEHVGLGLENLKKRLEMIYPNTYELSNRFNNTSYQASLILKDIS